MKKSGLWKRAVQSSTILNFVRGTVNLIREYFYKSASSTVLTSNGDGERLFRAGKIGSFLSGRARRNSPIRRFSRFVASGFERSFICRFMRRLYDEALCMKLRTVGSFLLTYSIFATFSIVLQYYAGTETIETIDVFLSLLMFVLSIPLLVSGRTVLEQLSKSRFLGPIIVESLGVNIEDKARELSSYRPWRRLFEVAPVLGILLGSLTVFVPASRFVVVFAAIPVVMLIAALPEAGVILMIGSVPVYSLMGAWSVDVISLIIYVTLAGYICKVIRGKRTIQFGYADIAVLFVYVILLSAGFGPAASGSFESAQRMATFVIAYFLFVFLMKSRAWIRRSVNALIFSWVSVAFLGIVSALLSSVGPVAEFLENYCSDPDRFFVFGRSGYAVYMILPAFPFLWARLYDQDEHGKRFPTAVFLVLMLGCVILGGNIMPLGSVISELIVFVLCVSPALIFSLIPLSLIFFLLKGLHLPLIYSMLTSSVEFASAISLQNVYANKGVFRAMADGIISGVGLGSESFSNIYPNYAFAGFETLTHSGSSLLDLIFGLGILSFAVIALVLFFCLRSSFGHIRRMDNGMDSKYLAASVASVIGILFSASADSVFVCETTFLYLWILVAFGVASARNKREEESKATVRHLDTPTHADIDMPYVRVNRKATRSKD